MNVALLESTSLCSHNTKAQVKIYQKLFSFSLQCCKIHRKHLQSCSNFVFSDLTRWRQGTQGTWNFYANWL